MKTTSVLQTIAAVALLALPTFGYAQDSGKESKWTITPRAGITISTLTGDDGDVDAYDARLGFGGGIEAEYHFNKTLGLSLGAFYTKQGAKLNMEMLVAAKDISSDEMTPGDIPYTLHQVSGGKNHAHYNVAGYAGEYDYVARIYDIKAALGYINIPLMLNVHLPLHLPVSVTAKAGTQLDILLSAKDKGKQQTYITGTYGSSNYTSPSLKGDMKDFGFSVPVGLAVGYKNIELDARYLWNVTDINDVEKVDGSEPSKQHNSTFLVTLGYNFNL